MAGISGGGRQGGGLPGPARYIGSADALLHVVRAFEDAGVPHPDGSVNLARDIQTVGLELAFSDLAIIEKRLGRLSAEITKMSAKDKELRIAERDLLARLQAALEAGNAHPRRPP